MLRHFVIVTGIAELGLVSYCFCLFEFALFVGVNFCVCHCYGVVVILTEHGFLSVNIMNVLKEEFGCLRTCCV